MGWRTHLAEGLKPVVDLVYPPRCPSCGEALAAQGGLCIDCWSLLETPDESSLHEGGRIDRIFAATVYNETSRKLILAFKHGGKIALAPLFARMMAAQIDQDDGRRPLLIPVPLHRTRLWQRGYNQSGLLARELAKLGKGELLVDGLVRTKRTPSLGGLGGKERRKILSGAIKVRPGAADNVRGRDVILVDDVLTSGATSEACAVALMSSGATRVNLACFATAQRPAAALESKPETETPEVR